MSQERYLFGVPSPRSDLSWSGSGVPSLTQHGSTGFLNTLTLTGAALSEAHLKGATLRQAYLSDADLDQADLRDADLRDSHLAGANLNHANLSGADLQGARYNDYTEWSVDFDPKAAGAIFVVST